MTDHHRDLYAAEVERHVLALRECLVRFDENLKAHRLLESVPYIATDRPAIVQARSDQREMVLHALHPEAYEAYYRDNPNERPFEEQYGIEAARAHEGIYRVAWLRDRLPKIEPDAGCLLEVLDLSANDGWMAENLHGHLDEVGVGARFTCVDLNTGACERARKRPGVDRVVQGDFMTVKVGRTKTHDFNAVLFLETVEHLPDPAKALQRAASLVAPGGRLFVSTPNGAVEDGNLDTWARVERKGHLHSLRAKDFQALLSAVGTVEDLALGPDGVLLGEVVIGGNVV